MKEKENLYELITITDPLIEPLYIVKDSYCYTVYERKNTSGNTYNKVLGYYSDLKFVLKRIAREKVKHKETYGSIQEFIREYNKIHEEIEKLLNPIKV